MSCSVRLDGVTLDYFIYSVKAQSLRNAVFNLAVGGNLYKSQGDVTVVRALENISLDLVEGDRLALVGHNGSGKTSLLKVIAGIYEPQKGIVDVKGKLTSMIAHGAGLDADASGLQNIRKLGAMRLIPKKVVESRIDSIVEFSELGDFVRLPVKTYSSGMMARLMFACATEFEADIIVLDEWLGAGDAAFGRKASNRMQGFVDKAQMVILGTHNFGLVERVCNKVIEIAAGRAVFYGTTADWIAWRNQ